ncbi:isoinhibitor K-like [Mytilus californianus]|uniref:isoinhibitor K-like n=1 Tax=Mytilus californianus TaxID=6549 RepID=UPI0022451047|nr:isoinhibitor K-like [Mytilus californianus]
MFHCVTFLVLSLIGIQVSSEPLGLERNVCWLPASSGPCYGYFNKYYFNKRSGKCEKFVYGGCQGNANNFETLMDCEIECIGNVFSKRGLREILKGSVPQQVRK